MGYRIVESLLFQSDLESAVSYLIHELKSMQAAKHLMTEVDKAYEIISDNPYIRAVSKKDILEKLNIREYLVMNYVILYIISDSGTVEFVRFYHQAQDFERYFSR